MATNQYQRGDVFDHVAGSDISSGDVVVMDTVIGVAIDDIATGATGPVAVTGVWELAKDGSAYAQGAAVEWDGSTIIAAAAGDKAGVVAVAAAGGDATVYVLLER